MPLPLAGGKLLKMSELFKGFPESTERMCGAKASFLREVVTLLQNALLHTWKHHRFSLIVCYERYAAMLRKFKRSSLWPS